jgi:ATP-binding cassette, subfamily B, heavy metal transporter
VRKEINPDLRASVSQPPDASAKPAAPPGPPKKKYGLWDFTKFTVPYLWKGGFWIRLQTIMTFIMLLLSRGLNVLHPIILKLAIDAITTGDDDHAHTYMLIAMYCVVRFLADFVNNVREIPFANVSASAEIYIAHLVYNHI